jgi:serine protease Do
VAGVRWRRALAGLGVAAGGGLVGATVTLLAAPAWPPRPLPAPGFVGTAWASPAVAVYRRAAPSVVLVAVTGTASTPLGPKVRSSWGSGVIFDPRGFIVTNEHVVLGADSLAVTLADGTRLPARLVGGDPSTDLAVVAVHAGRPLPAATFADPRRIEPGELAVAIGNPLGPRFAQSVTQGVVSAVRPMLYGLLPGAQRVTEMIQTDAAINPGNSGGPLLDAAGEVIGITSVKVPEAQPGVAAAGLGFAIPAGTVRRVVEDIVRYGHVRRAWLGAWLETSPANVVPGEPQIVTVRAVQAGGPAAAAGVLPGDRIVAWDGDRLAGYYDLVLRINAAEPGQRVRLGLERGGRTLVVPVTLGEEPQPAPSRAEG